MNLFHIQIFLLGIAALGVVLVLFIIGLFDDRND